MRFLHVLVTAALAVAQQQMPVGTPEPPLAGNDAVALELELARFPAFGRALECYELAADHYACVLGAACFNSDRDWYPCYVKEAENRKNLWSHLRYASDPNNGDFARQCWLDQLRDTLPEGWYECGLMPAPMPCLDDVWR